MGMPALSALHPSYAIANVIDILEIGNIDIRSRAAPVITVSTVRLHMCAIYYLISSAFARSSARSPTSIVSAQIVL